MTGFFIQAFIYLAAAVVMVPVAKRLGLGSVLGYLVAGVIIGPVAGLVGSETTVLQHYAEFGVVMMLFLVGMELEPALLWSMRHKLLGLGGLQVLLTTVVISAIALLLGRQYQVALTVGLILALSSTAIILQTLNEKKLAKTDGGKDAFLVLLFQDIAVIPILAIIPLLALPELVARYQAVDPSGHEAAFSLADNLSHWAYALVVLASIAVVVVGAHFLSRPLFQFVARSSLREVFVATALMLVIGVAALMSFVGLSPALGAFLAGVVLANSEFKHELESNIEPFKGLLLGLFFITVGAGIDFGLLTTEWELVACMTLGVILLKIAILWIIGSFFKLTGSDKWLFALSLAQAGEFGFVLVGYSLQHHVLTEELASLLSLVVALSMFLTPGLFILFDKVIVPLCGKSANRQQPADEITEKGTVVIAGIGRFGQIVNRFLTANGFTTIAIDHQYRQVELMRKIRVKSFYGDATLPDLLHTAGVAEASLLVVAIDDREGAVKMVKYVKQAYPSVPVFARAFDRGHMFELKVAGADSIVSETYYSALEMGRRAVQNLGIHPFRAMQQRSTFVELEKDYHEKLFKIWQSSDEDNRFSDNYRTLFLQLEDVIADSMKKDRYLDAHDDRGWTPPPKA